MIARHALVKRLDDYTVKSPELFTEVVNLIQTSFSPIIKQQVIICTHLIDAHTIHHVLSLHCVCVVWCGVVQALQGKAIIRCENPLLSKPHALDIFLVSWWCLSVRPAALVLELRVCVCVVLGCVV